jgi:hypothetical protein
MHNMVTGCGLNETASPIVNVSAIRAGYCRNIRASLGVGIALAIHVAICSGDCLGIAAAPVMRMGAVRASHKTAQSIMHMGAAITTALREYRHRHGSKGQHKAECQRQDSG